MRFQQKTLELIAKVNGILAQYEGPVTLRQIYYRLVASQIIPNQQSAYKNLSAHLTNARREGLVDASRIVDRTRRTLRVSTWDDLKQFIEAVRKSYRREKWSGQPWQVEVWCEKDAIAGVLQPITDHYEVVLYPCRGYNSYSALREAAYRLTNTPRPAVILYLGDFDPSGQDMPRDIVDRLYNDFQVAPALQVIALTPEQIAEYDLPPAPAKRTDSRAAAFISEHGDATVELDALEPGVLQELVRDNIDALMDEVLFAEEVEKEQAERAQLRELI